MKQKQINRLTENSFKELCNESFSCIQECLKIPEDNISRYTESFCKRLSNLEQEKWKPNTIQRLGGNYGMIQHEKINDYFQGVVEWDKKINEINNESNVSLINEAKKAFESINIEIERLVEPDIGDYASGVIKQGASGLIHYDQAFRSIKQFELSKIYIQLGCTIPIMVPTSGGNTYIYDATPDSIPANDRLGDSLDPKLLKNIPYLELKPKVGYLQILNAQYWHKVGRFPTDTNRITFNFFIGQKIEDNRWYYWS